MRRVNIAILLMVAMTSSQQAYSLDGSNIPNFYEFISHVSPIIGYLETHDGLTCKNNTELLSSKLPYCKKFNTFGANHYLFESIVIVSKKMGTKRQIRIKILDDITEMTVPYFVAGKKIILSIDDYRLRNNPKAWNCLTNIDDNLKFCQGLDKAKQGLRSIVAKVRLNPLRGVRQINYLCTCNYHPEPFTNEVPIDYKKIKKPKKVKKPKVSKVKKHKTKKPKIPKSKKNKSKKNSSADD